MPDDKIATHLPTATVKPGSAAPLARGHACALCGGHETRDFFEWPALPTQDGFMCASREEAHKVVRGGILLRFCSSCGYVGNECHEASRVQFDDYDFSNHQSPIYTRFTEALSRRLIDRYGLEDKSVLEIGCGEGDFLQAICRLGHNRGVGIDPGFDHPEARGAASRVSFLREYYSAQHRHMEADLVACRHMISLPNDPLAFLGLLRDNLEGRPETVVYIETPNVRSTFGNMTLWNVVYEHRSWFAEESIAYLLQCADFEVLDVGLCWNDAYLYVEARPGRRSPQPELPAPRRLTDLDACIDAVSREFSLLMTHHQEEAEAIRHAGKRTVAWGSGAAAVSYFNLFDLTDTVPYIVDINPKRHGKFLPGTGQEIVAPEFITRYRPELLIITNPTYEAEIREQLKSLGVDPEIITLRGRSDAG